MSSARLLPADIARLKGLAVRARAVVEGVFSGLHKSVHRGASRDFSDHKEYSPGDDVRYLDWKAYARFDRPLVRRFDSDTERSCLLALDCSASMEFGAKPLAKLEYARILTAALAFLLLGQRDRVGLGLLTSRYRLVVPPRARGDQLAAVLSALEAVVPAPDAGLASALQGLVEAAPRRSLVVVISDLLDPGPGLLPALRRLATHGREVAVLQVLSPEEEEFPYDGHRLLVSPERAEDRVAGDARDLRRAYLRALAALQDGAARAAREAGFDLQYTATREPPADVILRWLAARRERDHAGAAPGG